ncbi:MAG TPA: SUMF1/EgtB/PvdO family nonheme iron enzyme [Candidatus Limnocylindria bacterium]|nr:SUMF1/EgtB/PvdO family nonheme iron enzyme [Candidatus Limnocylindria bacterium]
MTRWRWVVFCVLLAPACAAADGIMLVEAGAFWMGRDDGPADEAPRHRVYVPAVWLERHKVTNAEFAVFLNALGPGGDGGRRFDVDDPDARIHRTGGRWVADAGFEGHPVVEVSWFGARDYCAWRGRRLPTEAEWEKAARGDDGRRWPWGDAPADATRAVLGRPYGATAPTAGRDAGAGPHGVMDLVGNLREWTATVFRPYPYRHDDGREPFTGAGRVVLRGASHDDDAAAATVTARHTYDARGAAAGHHHVGFRCATSEDLGERYTR